MKVLIPVACYHEYNTARYVEKAFRELGHDARVITQGEFYGDNPDVDLFFGVDSAGPLDFPEKHLNRTMMWFIDSRHNNDPRRRTPDDDTNARRISDGGGWVLQAQKGDWKRNVVQGAYRSIWLPLAADPDVWRPEELKIQFDVGFGGNVWDDVRGRLLTQIGERWKLKHSIGTPEELSTAYNESRVGFNISSFYGSDVAYDINMRVFEVMSCGRVLITNELTELVELGIVSEVNCLTYGDLGQAVVAIEYALNRDDTWRKEIGAKARRLITEFHTYKHRIEEALEVFVSGQRIAQADS